MDKNNDKKKESIDEILSDLNGLLNKMPSILDGIKMPDIKPVEFSKPQSAEPEPVPAPAAEPEPVPAPVIEPEPVPAPVIEPEPVPAPAAGPETDSPFDKTLIIDSLAGLAEGSPAPRSVPAVEPEQAPAAADTQAPEGEKLVPQSLGDFMFGGGGDAEPSAGQEQLPGGMALPVADLNLPSGSGQPAPEEQPAQAGLEAPDPEEENVFLKPADILSPEASAPERSGIPVAGFGPQIKQSDFRDSAIPDIDALMQLPDLLAEDGADKSPAAGKEPAPLAQQPQESVAEPVPAEAEPSADELVEFEKQLAAAVPGGVMERNEPEKETPGITPEPVEARAPEQPFEELPAAAPAADETLRLDPAPEAEAAPEGLFAEIPAAAMTVSAEPVIEPRAVAADAGETLRLDLEPGQGAVNEPVAGLSPGTPTESVLEPQDAVSAFGGVEVSASPVAESTMNVRSGDGPLSVPSGQDPSADMTLPGISLEPRTAVSSEASASDDSEKTMLVAPPSAAPEEEQTVIFEAGSAGPGTTSRAKAGDLAGLSQNEPPPGLPEERIRPLYFLYSDGDAALCASLLMELDTVCLRSQTSPMFIRRAGVKVFEQDMNPNFVAQTVNDSGAKGLICIGGVPQEKVYEIENVFASSGVYFKHFDSTSFSHSAVLDLLLEVILR
ncbi:MAG: hypothetical protein COT18_12595 [Elusimicrobia bacterium CG08_land_8_20_14_0_20_59_10]|nr:MAG: hypothetical protein COT18_12595 [Elusimicrobia bacterium CG08_land_8_20_14_0_20_59_10]